MAGIASRFVCPVLIPTQASRSISANTETSGIPKRMGNCGTLGGSTSGGVNALAVLLTVTVNAYEDDPFGGAEVGETLQVDGDGAPLQVSATVPLKPLTGEIWRS